jgi:GNAT superfamily N-acetyltransferase
MRMNDARDDMPGMTPAERLERSQWDLFWRSADVVVHDRSEILYGVCPRDVPNINCVSRTRAPAARLPALVQEVVTAHARVRSRWQVHDTTDVRSLETELDAAAYSPRVRHFGYVVRVDAFRPRPSSGVRVERVRDARALDDHLRVNERAFGSAITPSEEERRNALEQAAAPEGRVHRFVAYDDAGEPVSSGGLTVFRELSFGFLWAGGTIPEARGRGSYSAVVAARIALARDLGLRWVGVYARVETSAPIVEAQGFERVSAMTYWVREPT